MNTANKDVVYVDIDDEITSVIDKVQSSKKKIVALVLPKRATMLQSIVNMKLLKRTAKENKKQLVLITSEAGILPLAGAVGLHVAKTLQSKPAVPSAPKAFDSSSADVPSTEVEIDNTRPIGELAAASGTDESIELDNDSDLKAASSAVALGAAKNKGIKSFKKDKKLKIPNFESFRLRLILGVLALILLAVGWYFANYVMPRATVVLQTNTSQLASTLSLTASTDAEELDEERSVVPAQSEEVKKDKTATVKATGEKDKGKKATGEVTLRLIDCSEYEVTIPEGTGISSNNMTFIIQESATLSSVRIGNQCMNEDFEDSSTEVVSVVAQKAGEKYNLESDHTFTVAGYSSVSATNGNDMSGGTTDLVKVVTKEDIESAKEELQEDNDEEVKSDLSRQLSNQGHIALEDTFEEESIEITKSPKPGDEAKEVTINGTITYRMLGVNEDNLKKLVEKDVEDEVDKETQVILNYGLDDAVFRLTGRDGNSSARLELQTIVEAGPQLDKEAIKQEIAGKKKGEVRELLMARPGVQEVAVRYTPIWVSTAPTDIEKLTVIFESANESNNQQDESQ